MQEALLRLWWVVERMCVIAVDVEGDIGRVRIITRVVIALPDWYFLNRVSLPSRAGDAAVTELLCRVCETYWVSWDAFNANFAYACVCVAT